MKQPRLLEPADIEVRIQQCKQTAGGKYRTVLLLYKTARTDMAILDDTFGAMNWSNSYQEIKGRMYCTISVRDPETGSWVSKQDCGTESNMEAEKGEASDAFKRAGTRWGIGRELYTGPVISIFTDTDQKFERFEVKSIAYDDRRCVTSLEIARERTGETVYSFCMPKARTRQAKPAEGFDKADAWRKTVELTGSDDSAKAAWLGTGIKSSKEMTGEKFMELYRKLKAEKEANNG